MKNDISLDELDSLVLWVAEKYPNIAAKWVGNFIRILEQDKERSLDFLRRRGWKIDG
jgi:hypothetical protein